MSKVLELSRLRILNQTKKTILKSFLRSESISADAIQKRSPYEELKVEFDSNSSKKNPMKVNAFGDQRTIACVCDNMHFMTLEKGPPVSCKCGYWFQLVDANKFWLDKSDS